MLHSVGEIHCSLRTSPMLVLDHFLPRTKRVRTLVKRTCISQGTNRTMAKDEYDRLETTELKETIFMSTVLLTRASIVDLLKHLHPSHFFSWNDLQWIHNLCPKMGSDLESSRKISTHHSLQRQERNPSSSETGTFDARRSGQRKTIPYQTNLNSISSHTKSNSCR